jgi:GT2 family glycosyltransferase
MQLLADAALKYNALVGPTIVNPAGEDETRARNHSTMIMDITDELLPRRFMRGALERNISMNNRIYRVGGPVPYIQGSCMALAADAFRSVGGFDERFFLYYEEESLARSLARVGVEVRLEPQAQITHIGGVSTSQTPYFSIGQLYRSKALFYSIHFSRIRSSLFASTLWSLFKIMSMATSVRRIANIREDRDREWYRSAAQGVMSGRKSRMVDPPDLALRRERYSKGRSSSPGKTLVKPSERK